MKHYLVILSGLALASGILAGVCFGAAGDERFYGGSYDGYDLCAKTNMTIQAGLPSGTIIIVR